MADKKIMAVFMHESELGDALNFIKESQRQVTESFVVGNIDEDRIDELRSKGLIISVLEDAGPSTASRLHKIFPGTSFENMLPASFEDALEIETKMNAYEADFYILSIRGPLIEDYIQDLQRIEVILIEKISFNGYTTFLLPHQYNKLIDQIQFTYSFISNVRLYDNIDTGAIINSGSIQKLIEENNPIVFDLLLHRDQDLPETIAWLQTKNIRIIDSRNKKIRIEVRFDTELIFEITEYKFIKNVEQYEEPSFQNNVAREILMIESNTGGSITSHIRQRGEGELIGIADTGIDDQHIDLTGAIVGKISYGRIATNDTSDPVGHGTHVAGSIVGSGAGSQHKITGTAPNAKIYFQSLINQNNKITLPVHLQDLFADAYHAGARIHNNSWGSNTPSTYTINSLDVDEFVYNNKDMLIVISAGNQGNGATINNVSQGMVELGSIGAPATAKNAITVGASRSTRTSGGYASLTYGVKWGTAFPFAPIKDEKISGKKEGLAAFSSRGPTGADYRIKPDLVAPGTDIVSVKSQIAALYRFWGPYPGNPPLYAYMGGTSMAAPLVAGCAALVREYYRVDRSYLPSAALLKATLINGTDRLNEPDSLGEHPFLPNYHQGFGLLNMTRTIPNQKEQFTLLFRDTWKDQNEQFLRSSQRIRYSFSCDADGWLRICLAYSDFPVLAIQNKLQIILEHRSTKTKWKGNAERPVIKPVLPGNSTADNVQIIRLENAQAGEYLIQIYAETLLKPPQDFAVVITGDSLVNNLNLY